ncbi:Uncharacterized protein APZ42_014201 [Daphnia magna]|uniref:Uncharacterized protein n=1 Tax=Daphnia magna TaxID=35525 RepID=A0A162Q258_9CRUS|nr:Uncharacterized protein APZ42_014201 [Daphnia magna]
MDVLCLGRKKSYMLFNKGMKKTGSTAYFYFISFPVFISAVLHSYPTITVVVVLGKCIAKSLSRPIFRCSHSPA